MLLALSILGVGLLLGSVWWLEKSGSALSDATRGIRAAEEIQIALLASERARLRAQAREPTTRSLAEAGKTGDRAVERWLNEAAEHIRTPEEAAAYAHLRQAIAAYNEVSDLPNPPGVVSARPGSIAMDAAVSAAEHFIELNQQQADMSGAHWQRWKTLAVYLAGGLAIFIPLVVFGAVWFVRRKIYQPFFTVRDAISRYGTGEPDMRAPLVGPAELRSIATRFNETAENLADQRTAQLSFLAAVAHDLRNPLTVLKTAAGLLQRQTTPEGIHQRAALMDRQLVRLNRIVEDLLNTSRIEAGEFVINPVETELGEQVREVVALFEIESDQHRLVTHLPRDEIVCLVDPIRIGQVLTNLVSNAIKYSPDGGEVVISLKRTGGEAVIAVSDQGVGIAPDELPRIMEPFRRATLTAGDIPGVGLGLSVARRLIHAHGGRLEVESQLGKGSTFRVRLPCAEAAPANGNAT